MAAISIVFILLNKVGLEVEIVNELGFRVLFSLSDLLRKGTEGVEDLKGYSSTNYHLYTRVKHP